MTPDLELYHALFDTAPDAMIVAARDGRIVLANPQAARLFGYDSTAELVGAPVEALMPQEAHEAHRTHRTRYMDAPRVRPMGAGQELVGRRRDGSQFPVEIALSPIRTSDASYFVASIRDISETQRARQALARAHYDTALAQASQLALESPLEVTLERVPPLLASALGVDGAVVVLGYGARAELAVRASHGIVPSELDAVLDALAAAPGEAQRGAFALPVASCAGFAAGIAVRLLDVSQPMGALLALSRAPRELDREARQFVQQLGDVLASTILRHRSQEQLAHAQRLDAVGQLTGGVAHDFNNLLTVISGNLQLLEPQLPPGGEGADVIASALRAVARGAELTRKLLAFARRQRLSPRALLPQQLLADVGLMLRRTLGEQVDLAIRCDDVGAVYADPAQLDTALVNLALNARDAMPRGGRLEIAVRSERGSDDAAGANPGYVVFAVTDTGLGMSPEVQARAFEPFFTTKEQGKGSGLGLSMVYGFVKQSGGHIAVDSRLGYGTRIELFLPAADASRALREPAPPAQADRGREHVLVVEDEPEVRGIAIAFLRSLGYTVDAAANAEEALALLATRPAVDVLFSDVVLGSGASGGELAREAQRLRPGLRVLLTSGYERPEAHSGASPAAEFPLLRKPYRREELAEALRGVLDDKPGR